MQGRYGSRMTATLTPRHKRVAAEIRAAMAREGIQQKELAAHLGISNQAASQLYRGIVPFSIDRLDAMADWLNVRITDLLGDKRPDGGERRVSSGWTRRLRLGRHTRPVDSQLQVAA